jgi:hypothetical protein
MTRDWGRERRSVNPVQSTRGHETCRRPLPRIMCDMAMESYARAFIASAGLESDQPKAGIMVAENPTWSNTELAEANISPRASRATSRTARRPPVWLRPATPDEKVSVAVMLRHEALHWRTAGGRQVGLLTGHRAVSRSTAWTGGRCLTACQA